MRQRFNLTQSHHRKACSRNKIKKISAVVRWRMRIHPPAKHAPVTTARAAPRGSMPTFGAAATFGAIRKSAAERAAASDADGRRPCRGGKHDLLQRAHTVHRLLLPPTRLSHSTHSRPSPPIHTPTIYSPCRYHASAKPLKNLPLHRPGLLGASLSRLPTIDKRRRIKCRQLDACAWPRP